MIIIKESGTFETNSLFPKTDWYNNGNYIIDETTPEGKQMAEEYVGNYPFVDIKTEGQMVTEVIVLDRPQRPIPSAGQEVQLFKNGEDKWEYILVDRPLTELELLKSELEATQQAMDFLIMNGGI